MKFGPRIALILLVSLSQAWSQFLAIGPSGRNALEPPANAAELVVLLAAKRPVLRLHTDDVISVQVFNIHDYAPSERIADDGTVRLPLVGTVSLAGLTTEEAALVIQEKLSGGGFVNEPQVTVSTSAQPSAIVTVSGDVAKPGTFPAYGSLKLMDFISQAGGMVEVGAVGAAASSTVTLIRPSLDHTVSIPLGPNAADSPYSRLPLFPGDEIRVSRAGVVYAVGAFKAEGVFPLKTSSPTTVLELVAMAGGIGFQADRKDAHIVRTRNGQRYIVDVDVARILKGQSGDVELTPDDILFVPTNEMKAALKGGGSGVLVTLASALVYNHP
jgi:polysaccharide export outer membrane protein